MKIPNPPILRLRHLLACTATALLIALSAAPAATLVEYNLDWPGGEGDVADPDPTTTGAHVASNPYTVPGTIPSGTIALSEVLDGGIYYERVTSPPTTSQAEALANDFYSSFELDADPGFVLDLDELSFRYGGTTLAVNGFTVNFFVRSSVDTFASNIGSTLSLAIPENETTPLYVSGSVDLTAGSFQGLTSVTFRIYSYGTLDQFFTPANRGRLKNVSLAGDTSVIPEPTTWGLLAFSLATAVILLRRRQGRQGIFLRN